MLGAESERRQQANDVRIVARADENVARQQLRLDLPRRPPGAQADEQPLALDGDHRSPARQAEERPRYDPYARHESFLDDRVESGLDRRADEGSAAESRSEVAGGELRQRLRPGEERRGREPAGEALANGQDVRRHAVEPG